MPTFLAQNQLKILMGEISHKKATELQYHHVSATANIIRSIVWSLLLPVKPFFMWIKAVLHRTKCGPRWSPCHIVGSSEWLSRSKQRVESVIVDPRPPFSINKKLLTQDILLLITMINNNNKSSQSHLEEFVATPHDRECTGPL